MLRAVNRVIKYTVSSLFHDTDFVNIVLETVGTRLTSALKEKIEEQEEKIKSFESGSSFLSRKLDVLEQCARRNNLRFFGIPETGNENLEATMIQLCSEKLQIQLTPENIDFCRRIGESKKRGSRAVIVKFVNHKIMVAEDLTKIRHELLTAARTKLGKNKVWTRNGSILARTENGIKNINVLSDLE